MKKVEKTDGELKENPITATSRSEGFDEAVTQQVKILKPAVKLQAIEPKQLGINPSIAVLMNHHDAQVAELAIQIREHKAAKIALMRSVALHEGEDISQGMTISADNRVLSINQRPISITE
jgi:hypothetical protein